MLHAYSILYLFIIVFVDCENIYLRQNLYDINALTAFLSLVFLFITIVLRKDKETQKVGILPVTLILFLLYSALSFYFSLNVDLSLFPALRMLSALFLTLTLIYNLNDIKILKKVIFIIFIFGGIHAGIGILQQLIPSLMLKPKLFSSASTSLFISPNFFAAYLLIHIPFGFYLTIHCRSKIGRIFLNGTWAMILAALGFSGSAGGQLILIAQFLGMVTYLLIKKEFHRLKIFGWGSFLALGFYIGLVKIINQYPPPGSEEIAGSLIRRPWIWGHMENRFMYWAGAWSLFKENYLLGTGLWTFRELYPQTGLRYTPPNVHNMYLQTATETGLIGLGLLMVCLTALGSSIVRIFRRGSGEVVELNFYITVSLSGFLLHNLIEYNWLSSNFIYYFVFFVISIEVLNRKVADHKIEALTNYSKGIWSTATLLLMVLGAVALLQYYRYHQIIIQDILRSKTIEQVLENSTRAKNLCNRCWRPYFLSAIANQDKYRQFKDNQSLIQAEKDFKEVIQRNPRGLGTYLMLAEIKVIQGKFSEATYFYEKAMRDSRHKSSALTGLKNLAKNKGGENPESSSVLK